jgi:ubiquinone biosynthesis protein
MNPQRAEKIEHAVAAGIGRWRRPGATATPAAPLQATHDVDVVRPMPRRQPLHALDTGHVNLQMARRVVFNPGIIQPFLRLFVWLSACLQFFGGNAVDQLCGRDSIERRAVRLREVFDGAGVSFAKLAQQLSLRADLLPYAYCAELSKMLDRAQPFPTAEAITIIERSLGRPLNETFSAFDPEPIGSASLACVYQATLKSGERVAVKVRRPGIGPLLVADLRAMDWLLVLAETLTLVRPGSTSQFRQELRTILMSELNFHVEARYTEMFRSRMQTDAVTAPRVHLQHCTDEVLMTELMSGMWMRELMTAVDRNDQEFLSKARGMGIDPRVVARRLVQFVNRMILESNFFHADPHPANLIVLPNNRICFIDFGAVARVSTQTRNIVREIQYHMKNCDVERLVDTSVRLAGPLPPMDVDAANEAIAEIWADWLRALRSTDAEWWERSTSHGWLRYVKVAGEYEMPVSVETLQFFRATLLYDSIVMRLDKDVDVVREYKVYAQKAAKGARRRVRGLVQNRLNRPIPMDYSRIGQLADMAGQFAFSFQRRGEDPIRHFRSLTGKIASALTILLPVTIILGVLGFIADFLAGIWVGRQILWPAILGWAASTVWFPILLLLVALVSIRRALIRVSEPDRGPPTER